MQLPIYLRGDSIGIAVCPTGAALADVEIEMCLYTTGNGPRIFASTRGEGLPIVKGVERAVLEIPPAESMRLDPGIATLETRYTVDGQVRTFCQPLLLLSDAKITAYSHA